MNTSMITASKACFCFENSLLFSALKGDNYATIEKVYCFTSSSQFLRRSGLTLFAKGNTIRYDPTLVELTSNFFVLCTNLKIIIPSGWSLA